MKKFSCLGLLGLLVAPYIQTDNNQLTTSHTYFRVRPQFQVGSPERISTHRRITTSHDDDNHHKFNATLFGGKSKKRNDLGTFFMPFESNSVTVNGEITKGGQEILPQHFNLFSVQFIDPALGILRLNLADTGAPFKSTISLKPEQSVIGLGLSYTYDNFCIRDKNHWLTISAPIVRVKNKLNLCEDITNGDDQNFFTVEKLNNSNLTKELRTMKDAFEQECWEYGKISQKSLKETKLAFIQFQMGEHTYQTDTAHFCPYIGVTAPTGNTPEGEYVFEPIVGHGNHAGIFWGAIGGYTLGESFCKNFTVHYETDTVMNYYFNKKQKRSVDLKYRPWSRYNEVYKDQAQAQQAFELFQMGDNQARQGVFLATPGINELTFDMRVSPGFSFTSNHALLFDYCYCQTMLTGEFGYNFFFQQEECLKPAGNFSRTAALKDHVGSGLTNPLRTITNDQFINDVGLCSLELDLNRDLTDVLSNFPFSTITESDLDYNSAAHPCTISHTVYATLSGEWDNCLCPLNLLVGGSYEFSGKSNNALDRWLLWANVGVNF